MIECEKPRKWELIKQEYKKALSNFHLKFLKELKEEIDKEKIK